ncbi:MAG: GMP synthase-like glutamine amidotransferase [Oceanicoccus sp.]|jgi:GMP synthase-like glutamine amidotransferase
MNKEVLIFLHMDDEHPGYIADFLQQKSISYRIIRPYQGDSIPQLDDTMIGLIFMGGVMSANDNIGWIKEEIRLIQQALEKKIALLGHCLGGQLISKALRETVSQNPVKEVGWHFCYRQRVAFGSGWLGSVPDPFIMFHWHNETFAIPKGAQPLFSSEHCKNQAYSYGDNVLAMQCHLEMTEPLILDWIEGWREDLTVATDSQQTYEQIRYELADKIASLNRVADTIYGRWVSTLPR